MAAHFYGMEKLSLVDFDGYLSCTLFTAGCNFRCPYCHNKDLINFEHLMPLADNEVFAYLKKRKKLLDAVVITGGEPTLVTDLDIVLKKIKALGFLVKLDTNGSHFSVLKRLVEAGLVDYVAMDVKNSFDRYFLTAGIKANPEVLANIKQSIAYLKKGKVAYEFRTTLVKEFHDDAAIRKIGTLLAGGKMLFLQKFFDRGTCLKQGLNAVSDQDAERYREMLREYLPVKLRGY